MLKDKVKQFPLGPGIYLMRAKPGQVIYVGKAACLRKRVSSYFKSDRPAKTDFLMSAVADIEYIECATEAQALILEAAQIKEKKPKYNIALKDDKSYPYVEIIKEVFPRLYLSRPKGVGKGILFGPYPKVKLLKLALNMIRRLFPYASCRGRRNRVCLFFHLRLCPGPCANKVSPAAYQENIRSISKILKGERKELIQGLERKMAQLAARQDFEAAGILRDKLAALNNLYYGQSQTHQLIALQEVLKLLSLPLVVEAIDISCWQGQGAGGAVVVFRDGMPDKNSYRRYRIKDVEKIDDYAMIGEVVRRRYTSLLREKKALPDLVIIDGGKGHVQTAEYQIQQLGVSFPLIGIAKRNEEVWLPQNRKALIIPRDNPGLHFIKRIRDEAHRFAHNYHRVLRRKKTLKRL